MAKTFVASRTVPKVVIQVLPGALAANHQGTWKTGVKYFPGQTVVLSKVLIGEEEELLFWSCVSRNESSEPTLENPNWQLLGSVL